MGENNNIKSRKTTAPRERKNFKKVGETKKGAITKINEGGKGITKEQTQLESKYDKRVKIKE